MYTGWDKEARKFYLFSQILFGNGDFQNTHPGSASALITEHYGDRP